MGCVMSRPNTIKIYDGPSELDGRPIIVLISGFVRQSKNTKTGGRMLQMWIMRKDVAPHEAVKSGDDASVCGDCPLRPVVWRATPPEDRVSDKPCYVKTFQAPRATWAANKDREVASLPVVRALIAKRKFGPQLRRGAYGDPAAVPMHIWEGLEGPGTGYTHQWRGPNAVILRSHVMASVHSAEERTEAMRRGFRTFRIISDVSELLPGEISCPASKEGGARTTCQDCGLCDGSRGKNDKRKTIAIIAH